MEHPESTSSQDSELKSLAEELGLDPNILMGKAEPEVQLADNAVGSQKQGGKKGSSKKSEPKEPKAEKTATPKEPKQPKEPKEPKEPKPVIDKNAKAMEIEGIPANYQARPIQYDEQGNPSEMKVAWSAEATEANRQKGHILLRVNPADEKKKGADMMDVVAEFADGSQKPIISINNHNKALKRAKTWSVLLNLAFDPKKDTLVSKQK